MPVRHHRRSRRLLAAGLAAATLATAAACSGSNAPPGGEDGTLVFGLSSDPSQLLPWTATAVQSHQVLGQVYSTLLDLDAELVPTAGLAELPEISEDGLTYTFTLAEGVTFSDGSPLDSGDVTYSIEKILDPETAAVAGTSLASVESVSAPDARTVVIELASPDASLLAALTSVNTAILPEGVDLDSLRSQPVGSGPYSFESRRPHQTLTLVRNEEYFRGTPGVGTLQFRIIEDESSMVSALRSGAVDLAIFDDSVTAETATGDNVEVHTVDQLDYHALQLRGDAPVFAATEARLAVQCAIDREQVVRTAALGNGEVIGPITAPAYASDPDSRPCPTRDTDAAEQYLDDAGTPEGFTFTAIVPQGLYSSAANEAQNIQAQLAGVGITMNIETLDSSAYVDRWLAGDFDAAIALNGAGPDPATTYGRYFTSEGSFNALTGYRSENLDALFAEGVATTDIDERAEIYRAISEELEEEAAWIWLYTGQSHIAVNTRVSGFEPLTDARLDSLWETRLS